MSEQRPLAAYRLPSGRHGLSRQAVAENQRLRLMAATVELIGEGGLGGLTSAAIVRRASVSSRTFYQHFRNVDDCLTAVRAAGAAALHSAAASACSAGPGRASRIAAALEAIVELLAAEPGLVDLLGAEAAAAAASDREPRRRFLARLAAAIDADLLLPAAASLVIANHLAAEPPRLPAALAPELAELLATL